MRQTKHLRHTAWSVSRPLEQPQWQSQHSAKGHGSVPCSGFGVLCSQCASLSHEVPSSRTKGHFNLCIYTFRAWTMSAYTVETCWICGTERSWHELFVFIYLVWNCQGESNLLIDRGFPVERKVMGSIIRPCTWSMGGAPYHSWWPGWSALRLENLLPNILMNAKLPLRCICFRRKSPPEFYFCNHSKKTLPACTLY